MMLTDKVEEAFQALIAPAVADLEPDVQVSTGKSAADRTLRQVICAAQGEGDEDPPMTGNFWFDVEIQIRHGAVENEAVLEPAPAQDVRTQMQEVVDAVLAVVLVDTLPADLTAAADDFTVFPNGVLFGAPTSGRDGEGVWVDQVNLRVYCCGADLA